MQTPTTTKRRAAILRLIEEHEIETQKSLTRLLSEAGFSVTQGTISRDIRRLGLIKRKTAQGAFVYAKANAVPAPPPSILVGQISSIEQCANILVIKTRAGMAMAMAAQIDQMPQFGFAGTIAGDDTIFAALKTEEQGRAAVLLLRKEALL